MKTFLWPEKACAHDFPHRLSGGREADPEVHATRWPRNDLPETQAERAEGRSLDLRLPSQGPGNRFLEPGLRRVHHIHPPAPRLPLPGGSHGLAQPFRHLLGTVENRGHGFLPGGNKGAFPMIRLL